MHVEKRNIMNRERGEMAVKEGKEGRGKREEEGVEGWREGWRGGREGKGGGEGRGGGRRGGGGEEEGGGEGGGRRGEGVREWWMAMGWVKSYTPSQRVV